MLSRSPWERFRSDRRAVACLLILCAELLAVLLLPPLLGLEPTPAIWRRASGRPLRQPIPWAPTTWAGISWPACSAGAGCPCSSACVPPPSSALVGIPLGLLAGYRRGPGSSASCGWPTCFRASPALCWCSAWCPWWGRPPSIWCWCWACWVGRASPGWCTAIPSRSGRRSTCWQPALGGRTGRILRSNVLPNVIAPVWCALPLRAGRAILSESSLSFLGVGIRTPQASWGNLIQYAASLPVLTGRPWVWVPPGLCIILTVLCLQGIGDGLRDALDPRYGGHRGK